MNALKEKFTNFLANASLKAKSYSEVASCGIFAFEPELPEDEQEDEEVTE